MSKIINMAQPNDPEIALLGKILEFDTEAFLRRATKEEILGKLAELEEEIIGLMSRQEEEPGEDLVNVLVTRSEILKEWLDQS